MFQRYLRNKNSLAAFNYLIKSRKSTLWNTVRMVCESARANSVYQIPKCMDFKNEWPEDEKRLFIEHMDVHENFITPEEENSILEELEPYLKRLHYEFDHWDDAIHGYRETERKHWYPHNKKIIQKVSDLAIQTEMMPFIHVLDLAEKGVIKPHVDSTRYCGTTIAGLSLLSDCVMRLVRIDELKYKQDEETNDQDQYRNQTAISADINPKYNFYVDILLRRNSLYIMKHSARYNFTHEILAEEKSIFKGENIPKSRRISIICRNEP